jgi:hypothetical protein
MYPVAPRIACTACKHEVFFAIRLRHSRLQLIHIFQGVCPTLNANYATSGKLTDIAHECVRHSDESGPLVAHFRNEISIHRRSCVLAVRQPVEPQVNHGRGV